MLGPSQEKAHSAYRAIDFGVAIIPSVSVVVPAKNEAPSLEHLFGTILAWVDEIVLVDGHSTDDTVAIAQKSYLAINIVHHRGREKGNALQAGFAAAKGEIIVMIDAGASTDGGKIPGFVAALTTGATLLKVQDSLAAAVAMTSHFLSTLITRF